jgi:hypothetical protein
MENWILLLATFVIIVLNFLFILNKKLFYYTLIVVYPVVGQLIGFKIQILGFTLNPSMLFGLVVLALTAIDFILLPTRFLKLEVAIVAFIAYALVISFFSPVRFESISWTLKIATWLFILAVATKVFDDPRDLFDLNLAVSIAVLIVIFSFLFSKLGYYGRSITYETGVELYGGGFQSGKALAYYLAVAIPVLSLVALNRNHIARPLALILIAASLAVIVLTFVRSPIVALLIGFMVYQYLSARYRDKDVKKMVASMIVIAMVIAATFYFLEDSEYTSRWREMGNKYTSGKIEKLGSGRVGGLIGFYDYYVQRAPWTKKIFGSGLGASVVYLGTDILIHNDFAEIIMGCGVVGIFLYGMILFSVFRILQDLLRQTRAAPFTLTIILALCNFFMFLAFHMTNISSGVFILSVWSLHLGATIGIGRRRLENAGRSQPAAASPLPGPGDGDALRNRHRTIA